MIKNKSPRKLMKHQKEAIRIIHRLGGRCGLFMAPGTGKTLTFIRYTRPERRKAYYPALIICRRDDYLTWEQELLKEGVDPDDILFIHHKTQDLPDEPPHWTIVSYGILNDSGLDLSDTGWWLYNNHFEIVGADECQVIKKWKTKRSQVVMKVVKDIGRRIPMTGTPITQSVEDAFMHGLFIDDGKTFGSQWWMFMQRFYIKCKMTKAWYIKQGSKKRIQKKLGDISYYVHEDDVMKLPTALPPVIKSCSMTGKQQRMYLDVLNNWEINVGSGNYYELDYVIDITQKLGQIASGFYYTADKKVVHIKNRKIKLLEELATNEDYLKNENSIIWVSKIPELDIAAKLAEKLGIGYIKYGGTQKQREAQRKQYRDDPSIQWFICNVERGVGMNELIKARNRVYFSNSTKVLAKEQSMRRNRRKGSNKFHKSIRTFELVTEGTIDLDIIKNLNQGIDTAQYIMKLAKRGLRIRDILTKSLLQNA